MSTKGTVFIFSAPSGAGKTTIAAKVASQFPEIHVGVSHTTRKPRGTESDRAEYFFVSKDEFLKMEKNGKFLETANVHGNLYGTSKDEVTQYIEKGTDVVLDIDVQGAAKIREKIEVVAIFILPPNMDELMKRLTNRDTDRDKDIRKRIVNSREEVKEAYGFDYLVVNNDLERAISDVKSIIVSERIRVEKRVEFLDEFLKDYEQ
jgi:guanylate kinase